MLGLLGLAAFTFGLVTAIAAGVPSLDPAKQKTQANTYVYASDGHTILAILRGSQARIVVRPDQISPWMKHAIVAIEDQRFYEHRGVDVRGILRAVWADATNHGAVQGGSTITQQFVKNSINQTQRTISRKLREAALAWQLEQQWPKDKILTAYLNTIYFGNGAYGVEQASRIYFHHPARKLKPFEAALLAGIPADPTLYDPVAHPRQARARRNLVLRQLYEQHFLTHRQYVSQLNHPMPDPGPSTQGQGAPYFANYVKDQLVHHYGPRRVLGGGLRVKTTIDLGLQKLARQAVAKTLPPDVGPAAALVALDARTGAVLAMIGGPNYHRNQFNLATQGERQPGSSFKPFVLATALRAGIAPSTTFVSRPVTINASGRLWQVENYEGEYLGTIDLAQATAYSDNSVYSQLTSVVGPRNVAATAKDLGITTPLRGYFAIGLGAEPATPLEMARAYASFANGGYRIDGSIFGNEPRAVESVQDAHGVKKNKVVERRELTTDQAATEDSLLQGVVRFGTGRAAQISGREVAGKTGTTENYGDAWFVGFTPQIVTAVWVGYPNKLVPMEHEYHGRPVAGGTYPALIWKAFTESALQYLHLRPESFPAPPNPYAGPVNVVFRHGRLERDNGVCRGVFQLTFFAGQEPPEADCRPNEVDVPDVRGNTLADAKERLAAQPLSSLVVYRPARPGEHVGVVLSQMPRGGNPLSAGDEVTLVLAKPQHGVVPRVVGLPVRSALAKLGKAKLRGEVGRGSGTNVVAQTPHWGVAAAPGMRVTLSVGKGG